MQKQTHRHKQSFTLIELLIVIAIIAILAAVIVANVTSAQAQARDVRRTQDLDQLRTALEMYYLDHGSYPYGDIGSHSDDGFCIEKVEQNQGQNFKKLLIDGDYISSLPQDPLYNTDQCDNPFNLDCHCYIYRTETQDKYKLFAKTEQQDFKPATQDGGVSTTYYEAYAPVQGANQIGLGPSWYEGGQYYYCGIATVTFNYNNQQVTYGTVVGANNKCWLDRNLGADPNIDPSEYTGPTDSRGYGDLFQWGRPADGHQLRTSSTTTTLSSSDVPGHSNFILAPDSPYDWRSDNNNNRWYIGDNNPCPSGWRIPTETELNAERASWSSNNSAGAFASPLKLTVGGYRNPSGGSLSNVGSRGYYWSSTVSGAGARSLHFDSTGADMGGSNRANGFSVRCVKD